MTNGNYRKDELTMAKTVKKIMKIEGMSCGHCQARVEKSLNAIEGVIAQVDLKKKIAKIELEEADITDERLLSAVREAGYEPISIEEKRGIFG
jgi:copper chaperone CopZ